MAVVVHLDKLLVEKKMTSRALAAFIGITEQNLSLLKSGKVKGIRYAGENLRSHGVSAR